MKILYREYFHPKKNMMPEEAVYDYVVRSMIGKILNTMDSDQSYDIACKKNL